MSRLHLLIVENDLQNLRRLLQLLQRGGYEPAYKCVESLPALEQALEKDAWELIISGLSVTGCSVFDMITVLRQSTRDLPLIILAEPGEEGSALRAMQAGAADYILWDNPGRLLPAVERELQYARSRREHRRAESILRRSGEHSRRGMELLSYLAQSNELPWVVQMVLLKMLEITGFDAGLIRLYEGDNYSFLTREELPQHFFHSLSETADGKGACTPGRDKDGSLQCVLEMIMGRVYPELNDSIFQTEYGSIMVSAATDLNNQLCLANRGESSCSRCIRSGYETLVRIPLKTGQETIGLLYILHLKPRAFNWQDLDFLESVIHPLGYAIKHMQDQDSLKESYTKIQSLSTRLLRAYEKERARLARELHDEVGQTLTALKLDMQLLERDLQEPGISVRERLAQSISLMNTIMDLIHAQAVSLRPPALTDMGLLTAVRNMAKGFSRRTGIPVDVTDEGWGEQRFSEEVETALFRCVQESLTNVYRHARAGQVNISFKHKAGELGLQVEDDGIGFDPRSIDLEKERIGLAGMQERVDLINGTFSLLSQPGKGTLIDIKVKLPPFVQPVRPTM